MIGKRNVAAKRSLGFKTLDLELTYLEKKSLFMADFTRQDVVRKKVPLNKILYS